jgi:hypothetical protein
MDMDTLEGQVDFYHRMIEAMKFSDADRMRLGDPDFDNTTWVCRENIIVDYYDFCDHHLVCRILSTLFEVKPCFFFVYTETV